MLPASAQDKGLALRNFVLDNQQGDLGLRFSVDLESYDRVSSMLQCGETLSLAANALLYRKRSYWPDESLNRGEIEVRLSWNADKEQYEVVTPDGIITTDGDLPPLLAKSWNNLRISLGPFSDLEPGNAYALTLDVNLVRSQIPTWKRWVRFYSDFSAVPGSSYQMDFEY